MRETRISAATSATVRNLISLKLPDVVIAHAPVTGAADGFPTVGQDAPVAW